MLLFMYLHYTYIRFLYRAMSCFIICFIAYRNRIEQLFSSFALPSHPSSKFPKDNFINLYDSIDDNILYEEIVKFKTRHYSAHRIKFVVQVII